MLKLHIITTIFLSFLLTSCDSSSKKTKSCYKNEKETITISAKEKVDNNFNDFIEKFSSDSVFQLSRTNFPLEIKWYDIDNDKDSLIYKNILDFEILDFRKKKSIGQFDQWEQKIVLDKNNTSANIEIRGIENGIMVDYLFEKIEEAWILIKIEDSST